MGRPMASQPVLCALAAFCAVGRNWTVVRSVPRGATGKAARQMAAEGWQFAGYGDYGDEFLPPGA